MAQKSQEKGVAGPAPVVNDPSRVRNVVLVGHSGAGKTTLVEALLAATGTISRAGSVTEGTTVSDHDPATVKQQRSVSLSCAPLMHNDTKVNLLDTPGYADFVGELRAGLRAADAALFVVSSVDGMDAATAALWEECAAVGMPRAVAVTRLDHQRSDFDETLAVCQRVFGDNVMPLYLPLHGDDGTSVAGLIGLISQRVYDYTNEYPPQVRVPDPAGAPTATGHRHRRHAARPAHLRPERPAGGRGGQDDDRPVRRPGQPGPGLLRHAAPRAGGAHLRARHGRARAPRPRRRRAVRPPVLAAGGQRARGAVLYGGRHLRDHEVEHGRDR